MADNENAVTVSERAVRLELQGALTKREMFAMAAMQGLLSNSTVRAHIGVSGSDNKAISLCSIAMADALLAELEKSK